MKYLNFLFMALFITVFYGSAVAQLEQGSVRLGGDFALDRTAVSDDNITSSNTSFQVQISPAYFITQGFSAGIDLGYNWLNLKTEGSAFNIETTYSGWKVGPSLSYYIPSGNSKVYFPLTAFGGYQIASVTEDGQDDPETDKAYYYGANIGIEFIPANALGVRLSFGPTFINEIEEEGQDDLAIPVNWQVRVGVGYYFTKANEE